MVMVFINPGTETRSGASLDNAAVVAGYLCQDLKLSEIPTRDESKDADGWFHFVFKANGKSVGVDIPGDEPDEVAKGQPFVSRRLYVDGSSWLYGYACNRIAEKLSLDDDDEGCD